MVLVPLHGSYSRSTFMTTMTKELSKGSEKMIRYLDYCKTVQNRMLPFAGMQPMNAVGENVVAKEFSKLVFGMTFVSFVLS